MTPPPSSVRILAAALVLAAGAACAQQNADRDKPINYSASSGDVNYQNKTGSLVGNVVLTQGTLQIRADRINFKQNADNSVSASAYGNPVSFRQKRENSDEYYEGYAQHVEYDGQKTLLELFDRALLKRGPDEIRSNYISYNTNTEMFKAEGRPDAPATPADTGPGARVRGVFQPRPGESLPGQPAKGEKGKADAEKGKADAEKGKADAEKGKADTEKGKPDAEKGKSDAVKDKGAADKSGAPAPAPLPLKPSGELAAPATK